METYLLSKSTTRVLQRSTDIHIITRDTLFQPTTISKLFPPDPCSTPKVCYALTNPTITNTHLSYLWHLEKHYFVYLAHTQLILPSIIEFLPKYIPFIDVSQLTFDISITPSTPILFLSKCND